jgi:hypothetical protein
MYPDFPTASYFRLRPEDNSLRSQIVTSLLAIRVHRGVEAEGVRH